MSIIKRYITIPATLVVVSVIGLIVIGLKNSDPLYQSDKEILAIMDATGYSDIKLGMVVRQLPDGVFGPCKLFTAKNFVGDKVEGGYCTPKFLPWGVHILSPE